MTADVQACRVLAGKVFVAVLMLSVLAGVAARSLAPAAAWWQVLIWVAGGAIAVVALIALGVVVSGGINRFTLNHGGTDAQWMWWGGEPPGLQQARRDSEVAVAEGRPAPAAEDRDRGKPAPGGASE
jgi:hypothetical protein